MRRSRLAPVALAVLLGLLWAPVVRPALQAAILVGDLFSPALLGTNVIAWVTPEPRVREGRATFAGVEMRVTTWRPAWGDQHPGLLIVNGATAVGNDNTATRQLGAALARAGYLVMLPEFPFLREGHFDVAAAPQVDAAFASLRALPETKDRPTGAFGSSVGGGVLLSAAGREPALRSAAYLVVLGAYFDLDTYLASVATASQLRDGRVEPWLPSAEARERLPLAALESVPPAERERLAEALRAPTYEEALRRIRALPAASREVFDSLSPEQGWLGVRQSPVYWIHDPDDTYEPLAEAEAAAAAQRAGTVALLVPRVVSHAVPSESARRSGPLFVVGELWALITYTVGILRVAG